MKYLWIIEMGGTYERLATQCGGGFAEWFVDGMDVPQERIRIARPHLGEPLPDYSTIAGAVITGAHEMVTDRNTHSQAAGEWLLPLVEASAPVLGVCYGHQLLADAMGGTVGPCPNGPEFGTTGILLTPDGQADHLFSATPSPLGAQVSHFQSVLELPEGAVRLGCNLHEPNHAFRIGPCAWGVQFHPEFDDSVTRYYVEQSATDLTRAGRDVQQILDGIRPTPFSTVLLSRFARIALA